MSKPAFEGFPEGNVTFASYNRELKALVLSSAEKIANGTDSTPEAKWQGHYMDLSIVTEVPDPNNSAETLRLDIQLPINADDYIILRNTKTEALPGTDPEINRMHDLVDEKGNRITWKDQEPTVVKEPEPVEKPGVLNMFVSKPVEIVEEQPEEAFLLDYQETMHYKKNMKRLLHADYLDAIADYMADTCGLDEFIAKTATELERNEPQGLPLARGYKVEFINKNNDTYSLLTRRGVSSGGAQHSGYYSVFDNKKYNTFNENSSFKDEEAILGKDTWEHAVRSDFDQVLDIIRGTATSIRDNIPNLLDKRTDDSYKPHPYTYSFNLTRKKEYFSGYQQFLKAGSHLLYLVQTHQHAQGDYFNAYEDYEARVDICNKPTDESHPSHVVFKADTEPDSQVAIYRFDSPTGVNNTSYFGRTGGIYTPEITEIDDRIVVQMKRAGLSQEEIDETFATNKQWGIKENPYSHNEFYETIEYLNHLANPDS